MEKEPRASELRHALQRVGMRCTRQRVAVWFYLHSVECHPTVDQVFLAVRHDVPSISLATVYKALEALVEAGAATRVAGGPGPTRYDGRCEAHYHLRCESSGEVRDLPIPYDPHLLDKLDPNLAAGLRRLGFEVTGHRLELVGRFPRR